MGKTELSLQLAEFFSCPILNADSRQLYRDLPIGTAAPTAEEQQRVKHYFVGTLSLTDYYSAARYEEEACEVLQREFQQRDVMIMSGGSMMYIDAVCNGIDDIPTVTPEVRQMMKERLAHEGLEGLLPQLRLLDPEYYAQCDQRNTQRVVHALEVCYQTGQPYSSFLSGRDSSRLNPRLAAIASDMRIHKIGLNRPRPELFDRINLRVEQMLQDGLLEEARRVLPYRKENSLNTVGYKEMLQVLDGEWELPFATARMQKNTRVYAKKQLTWYQKDPTIHWFHPSQREEIQKYLLESLAVC